MENVPKKEEATVLGFTEGQAKELENQLYSNTLNLMKDWYDLELNTLEQYTLRRVIKDIRILAFQARRGEASDNQYMQLDMEPLARFLLEEYGIDYAKEDEALSLFVEKGSGKWEEYFTKLNRHIRKRILEEREYRELI